MCISTVNSFAHQNLNQKTAAEIARYSESALKYNRKVSKNAEATHDPAIVKNNAGKDTGNVLAGLSSAGEIAKEVSLSLIPIYGTVREFQKGNIGWGIFGVVTDILTLIPVMGSIAKATGTAIRGGVAAAEAARGLATTAEAARSVEAVSGAIRGVGIAAGASRKVDALSGAFRGIDIAASTTHQVEAVSGAVRGVKTTSEVKAITTVAVAKQFAAGASEGLAESAKDLGKAALRAVDPGFELLYEGGKFAGKKLSGIASVSTKSASVLQNSAKWKDISTTIGSIEAVNNAGKDLNSIKSASHYGSLENIIADLEKDILDGSTIKRKPYASQDLKRMPDLVKAANDKDHNLNLKFAATPEDLGKLINNTISEGHNSARFIVNVGDEGIHFAAVDYRIIDGKKSLIIFDSTDIQNYAANLLTFRTKLAIGKMKIPDCYLSLEAMDIQKSSSECGIFSLAIAKKLHTESSSLTKMHNDNVKNIF